MLDWDAPKPRRDAADASDAASRTDGAADQPQHDLPQDVSLDLPPDAPPDAPPADSADAFVPPTNTTCVTAQQITLNAAGTGSVSGDTTHSLDEYSGLKCKEAGKTTLTTALDGPQLYYSWSVKKGDWYKLTLHPKIASMYLYTFTNNTCTAAAIGTDCQAKKGHAIGVWFGDTEALYYLASVTGSAFFAVDSFAGSSGTFAAKVETIKQPTNATCAMAQQITLNAAGKGSTSGDTGPALTPDEFSTLRCGGTMTDRLVGPQVYYSVDLTAGATYVVSVSADAATNIYAYIFGGACTEAAIQADCTTNDAKGAVTGVAANGVTASLSFSPTKTGTYKIAVDSKDPSHFGGFTLTVEKQP